MKQTVIESQVPPVTVSAGNKISLYGRYIAEREGFEILEIPEGFATYKCQGHECYLRDIYVLPEYRQFGIAAKLADTVTEIAKSEGCTKLLGSVSPKANNADISRKVLKAYGMTYQKSTESVEIYSKEL